MTYFVSVETEALTPVADLSAALQRCYDEGAAGLFQIIPTSAPSFIVVFERQADEDAEYITKRHRHDSTLPVQLHAMRQLADELDLVGGDGPVRNLVSELRDGKGHCFDFGSGAIEALSKAEIEPETGVLADASKPVETLRCCCCGGAFKGRQFANQDTGWGLGDCCVERVTGRVDDIDRTYGIAGVHYKLDTTAERGGDAEMGAVPTDAALEARRTSYLVAAIGSKVGVLAHCFAHGPTEAVSAVTAMAMDSLGGDFEGQVIDEGAPPGVWITGDPNYILSVIERGPAGERMTY